MKRTFIDTNVLLRYLVDEAGDHSVRAERLFRDVGAGLEEVCLTSTVIFESVYILTRRYGVPRSSVEQQILDLLDLNGVVLPEKEEIRSTFALWTRESPLSFADCYHLVLTKSLGLTEIYSFDKKMGRYPGVTWVEP